MIHHYITLHYTTNKKYKAGRPQIIEFPIIVDSPSPSVQFLVWCAQTRSPMQHTHKKNPIHVMCQSKIRVNCPVNILQSLSEHVNRKKKAIHTQWPRLESAHLMTSTNGGLDAQLRVWSRGSTGIIPRSCSMIDRLFSQDSVGTRNSSRKYTLKEMER